MTDPRTEKPAMRRIVDIITRVVYVLSGGFYLLLGIAVLLLGTGILPAWVHTIGISRWARTIHSRCISSRKPALFGCSSAFCSSGSLRHYDQSIKFHWAMTFYFPLKRSCIGSALTASSRMAAGDHQRDSIFRVSGPGTTAPLLQIRWAMPVLIKSGHSQSVRSRFQCRLNLAFICIQ